MDEYIAQTTRLWAHDPTYGWMFRNGMNDQARHNAELEGHQLCTFIIGGFPPEKAFDAAYPQVEETATESQLNAATGRIASDVLCPPTG